MPYFAVISHRPFEIGIFPVEILGDVHGGNRECEYAAGGIACRHHFEKCVVQHVHLRLKLAIRLFLWLAADDHRLVFEVRGWREVERDIREWRLETDARRDVHIKDELLHVLPHLFVGKMVVTDEWRNRGIEVRERNGARGFALEGIDEIYDLPERGLKMLRRCGLDFVRNAAEPFESTRSIRSQPTQ